jgi:hypothetical protein
MENSSMGSTSAPSMDSYKIALPKSLELVGLDSCIIFCSSSSRPITFEGLSKDTCDELLNILINQIFSNFRACASPEKVLIRADPAHEKKNEL